MIIRNAKFIVRSEEFLQDDETLMEMFEKASNEKEISQAIYEDCLESLDNNDYLSFAIAKRAYEFAKEEYEALFLEMKKRELVTDCYDTCFCTQK